MARVRARAVHLHGINTLYHAVSVYTGMHKTLETLETLALRARVSKPVSAVLYIPVYTSTAWYNLYLYMQKCISQIVHILLLLLPIEETKLKNGSTINHDIAPVGTWH